MKTILYNPIFINPQAYYVFPQLYDIEKGDSFIEPATYSGYLLIEDLMSNTSSQVTDTREVDFTQFAGKRIRISQYTNIGAVVLGEWLLPEGEPSGPSFHQSLVDAWFMSGLSNVDKPSSIRGVKGNEIVLRNFAFTSESGFGEGTYEGALVFDGVDDYGICTGLPIMDDFTLICKREILNTSPGYVANKGLGNAGAFHFESSILTSDSNSTTGVWSYGTGNRVKLEESEVSWMTKNSYNGIELKTGNLSDVDQLYLCRFSASYTKAAIYYFALYNKSLTPEEIETEKERLNEEWLKRKTD